MSKGDGRCGQKVAEEAQEQSHCLGREVLRERVWVVDRANIINYGY